MTAMKHFDPDRCTSAPTGPPANTKLILPPARKLYDSMMTTKTFIRLTAWIVLAAVVFATLGPVGYRPKTMLPVDIERSGAFLAAGILFALAYPRQIWFAAALLLIGAVGLEWLQNLRPDRHGREGDAMVKLGGASIGLGLGWLAAQLIAQRRRTN